MTGPWFDALGQKVYDVLVATCGATDDEGNRAQFDAFWMHDEMGWPREFRFIGSLGFGGKFWMNRGRWYVNCYPEDETPERLEAIESANARLNALRTGAENSHEVPQ